MNSDERRDQLLRELRSLLDAIPGDHDDDRKTSRIKEASEALASAAESGLSPYEGRLLQMIVGHYVARRFDDLTAKTLASHLTTRRNAKESNPSGSVSTKLNSIRAKLSRYYAGRGMLDPFRFDVPPVRFTKLLVPAIHYNPCHEPLSEPLEHMLKNAYALLDRSSLDAYDEAIGIYRKILEACGSGQRPRILARLAEAHLCLAMFGRPPAPEVERAELLIRESLEMSDSFWEAHMANACAKECRRQWTDAAGAWAEAKKRPDGEENVNAHSWYWSHLISQGRAEEARALAERHLGSGHAFRIPAARTIAALSYLLLGDMDRARQLLTETVRMYPEYYLARLHLALALEETSAAEALRVIQGMPTQPDAAVTWGMAAFFHGNAGHTMRARALYAKLQLESRARYVPHSQLAMAAIGAGDLEGAVRWFEAAVDNLDPLMDWLGCAPWLRKLHALPSFHRLLDRVGLRLILPAKRALP